MLEPMPSLLIADDDPSIRFSLCEIFRSMGHAVRSAEDGFCALRQMAGAVPDILISDLNMPRMSGYELLSVVRRRFPSVHVIAMSGIEPSGRAPGWIAADGFYAKASGVVSLLKTVEEGMAADRSSIRARRISAPMWIPGSAGVRAEEAQVFIGCPECLRAFPIGAESSGSPETACCIHCRASIRFAVVERFV